MSRNRNWLFTLNNPENALTLEQFTDGTYLTYQLEQENMEHYTTRDTWNSAKRNLLPALEECWLEGTLKLEEELSNKLSTTAPSWRQEWQNLTMKGYRRDKELVTTLTKYVTEFDLGSQTLILQMSILDSGLDITALSPSIAVLNSPIEPGKLRYFSAMGLLAQASRDLLWKIVQLKHNTGNKEAHGGATIKERRMW